MTVTGKTQQQHPLPGFVRLADGVWFFNPTNHRTSRGDESQQPIRLVILCTWMGAALRHVSKYTSKYRELLPDSQLLVIQSNLPDVFWRTEVFQRARLAPARHVIRNVVEDQHAPGGSHAQARAALFMHVFSNGGCASACQLTSQLRAETGTAMSFRAMLFDSSPGRASFGAAVSALTTVLPPNPFRRLLGFFLVYIILGAMTSYATVMRREHFVDRVRRALNDRALFSPAVPRTYVFSKADKMIDWRDVQQHSQEARGRGYRVREEVFEASEHVAHALQDKDRYWRVVTKTYQQAEE